MPAGLPGLAAGATPAPAHAEPAGAKRLLRLAVAALARREYSRTEIERKLRQRLQPEETLQDLSLALDRLEARGLLCDRRMAEALVRTRAPRYGRLRLAQELDRRGVARDTIAAALPAEAADAAHALALWQRKFGVPASTPLERARQARYLLSRGYSSRIVATILRCGAEEFAIETQG
jgi:regulatory protein